MWGEDSRPHTSLSLMHHIRDSYERLAPTPQLSRLLLSKSLAMPINVPTHSTMHRPLTSRPSRVITSLLDELDTYFPTPRQYEHDRRILHAGGEPWIQPQSRW